MGRSSGRFSCIAAVNIFPFLADTVIERFLLSRQPIFGKCANRNGTASCSQKNFLQDFS